MRRLWKAEHRTSNFASTSSAERKEAIDGLSGNLQNTTQQVRSSASRRCRITYTTRWRPASRRCLLPRSWHEHRHKGHGCSAHFCHLNHFCHSSPVLSIHINRFCQPHHFCQLLSTRNSPVMSTISTTYVATDEVTTFVNKARPLVNRNFIAYLPTTAMLSHNLK